jgi:hypothetical protein
MPVELFWRLARGTIWFDSSLTPDLTHAPQIKIYDIRMMSEYAVLRGHQKEVNSVASSSL